MGVEAVIVVSVIEVQNVVGVVIIDATTTTCCRLMLQNVVVCYLEITVYKKK